jgi:hypothetical protein
VSDENAAVRELVRQRVPTMDHVEVLMRLYEAAKPVSVPDLVQSSRLAAKTVLKAAADLLRARLATHDTTAGTFAYSAKGDDRPGVDALAAMYNQKPVTLVRLVYAQPPTALQSFADAFRIIDEPKDE